MLIKVISLRIYSCIKCLFITNYMLTDILVSKGYLNKTDKVPNPSELILEKVGEQVIYKRISLFQIRSAPRKLEGCCD